MNDESSKDVWSKQFYKALEAVGNLTEQERLKLGNMLIALSSYKENPKFLTREVSLPEIEPLRTSRSGHYAPEGKVPNFVPPPPKPPETRKLKDGELIPKKPVYPEKVEIKP